METESADILIQRAKILKPRNVIQSLALLEEALVMSRLINYRVGQARANFEKGSCFFIQNNFKRSLTSLNEARTQFEELGDKSGILDCHHEFATVYLKLGDCPSALNHLLECLKMNLELDNHPGIAASHNEIGNVYVYLQDYGKAVEHFKAALPLFDSRKNKKEMANSYYLIGNAYNWMDDYEKALYYLLRSANSLKHTDDTDSKAKLFGSLAILYTKQKEYEKALSHFKEALNIAGTGSSPVIQAQLKKSLGNLYIELTQFDKAIEVLKSALPLAQDSPVEAQLLKIHEFLSVAYEKLNDHANALLHYRKFVELERQITSEEIKLKTKSIYIKYDLEELKKQKEIAELSDKMKEQFLANVSHEIRTPMNGVLGMAHLLMKTNPTQEQKEYIEAIKLSANNLMAIISDILDFSKINSGKIEFHKQEFILRELLKGTIQILRSKADEKNIQIGCTIDYRVAENMIGDPLRLSQILINLIGNAIKFTEKGKIVLDVSRIETKGNLCKIKFRVTDTGIGIPEEKLESIFNSFEQVENNKKRNEGTGLGLTIVKQLVELQGGTIRVQSRLQEGSEFTFELPFTLPEVQPKKLEQLPVLEIVPQDFSRVRVLIVEDNKINQLLVKNMLKKFGFSDFDCAENGKGALNCLAENNYDIILMDIQMPEMDGYEITIEVRTKLRDSIRNIPIIALTADASDKEKLKAREAGMNDYVVKPYTPEELYSTMLKYIVSNDRSNTSISARPPALQELSAGTPLNREMDMTFLMKFTGGDPQITIQLIELFLQEVPEAIGKLEKLIPQQNWKEIHAVVHKVKSAISIFELAELKKLILCMEECAREKINTETIPQHFTEFKNGCEQALLDLEVALIKLKHQQV